MTTSTPASTVAAPAFTNFVAKAPDGSIVSGSLSNENAVNAAAALAGVPSAAARKVFAAGKPRIGGYVNVTYSTVEAD